MKPEISIAGRRLLMKAVAQAEREAKRDPSTFDMREWLRHNPSVKKGAPFCGTSMCLAGHVLAASGFTPVQRTYNRWIVPRRVDLRTEAASLSASMSMSQLHAEGTPRMAAYLLGVPREDLAQLFMLYNWPQQFRPWTIKNLRPRVMHWLETGE